MNFWKDGFSIDESKTSIIIISFILTLLYAGYAYTTFGDISENMTTIILAQIASIAGINGVTVLKDIIQKNKG